MQINTLMHVHKGIEKMFYPKNGWLITDKKDNS